MDVALVTDGIVTQVWRNETIAILTGQGVSATGLVEFADMTAVCGMAWDGTSLTIPDPPAPTTAELKAYAAAKRYTVEIGGTVWTGHAVATDRDSQAKLIAEFVSISASIRTDPSVWKWNDGTFSNLSNADMAGVIMAARAHVEAAFGTESTVVAGIDGATITTKAQIDAADWPSNS